MASVMGIGSKVCGSYVEGIDVSVELKDADIYLCIQVKLFVYFLEQKWVTSGCRRSKMLATLLNIGGDLWRIGRD
jgi:hypothetical protein